MQTLLQLEKTDFIRTNVQLERRREARKNPRMRGNLGWGQGIISSFPNGGIKHKMTKQTDIFQEIV